MTDDDAWEARMDSYIEEAEKQITALRAEVERIRTQLDEAVHRIEDMLEDDDGQAWKEAKKFLLRIRGRDDES